MNPIYIDGATTPEHVLYAWRAIEDFNAWEHRCLRNEDGTSAAMKITVGEKKWFRRKVPTYDIYVHIIRNAFYVVKIVSVNELSIPPMQGPNG